MDVIKMVDKNIKKNVEGLLEKGVSPGILDLSAESLENKFNEVLKLKLETEKHKDHFQFWFLQSFTIKFTERHINITTHQLQSPNRFLKSFLDLNNSGSNPERYDFNQEYSATGDLTNLTLDIRIDPELRSSNRFIHGLVDIIYDETRLHMKPELL
jgi:hypothetical protein